jgi:hypothetical protein
MSWYISNEISGDMQLSILKKIYYLTFNLLQALFGNLFCRMRTEPYVIPNQKIDKNETRTPARVYVDSLVREILKSSNQFKSILDIGGGSGYIRKELLHSGFRGKYTCVDVNKHAEFDNFCSNKFKSYLAEERIEDFLCDTNNYKMYEACISISALEHIEDDIKVINRLPNVLNDSNIEIHVVPTSFSLPLYLFHGYRQYNRAKVKSILSLRDYRIYRIGGMISFLTHLLLITILEVLMKKRTRPSRLYSLSLAISIRLDKYLPYWPAMYMLVRSVRLKKENKDRLN